MVFDKNKRRARELERKDPERYSARIKKLKQSPQWWIRYYDKCGRAHDEKCPPEYQSEMLAQRYYSRVTTGIDDKTHLIPEVRKNTIETMCNFYLERKRRAAERKGKLGGLRASETLCRAIVRHIGKITFDDCRQNPVILEDHIYNLPRLRPNWSSKTIWNYFKVLKAVFNLWIKKQLLNVPNPMDAVDEPDPQTKVMNYVPTHADYEQIIFTAITEGLTSGCHQSTRGGSLHRSSCSGGFELAN